LASLNRIILAGKLAADAEARSTMDGMAMTKLHLIVERRPGLGQPAFVQSGADAIDVIAWRNVAEACSGLKREQVVLVEGRIQVRTFENQSGQRQWVTEVVAKDIYSLGELGSKAKSQGTLATVAEEDVIDDELESDLPF